MFPDDDVDEDKVGLKVEDGEKKKEEDDDNMKVSNEDVDGRMSTENRTGPRRLRWKFPRTLSLSMESWKLATSFP